MSYIKFVHVPKDKYFKFIEGVRDSEDIVECSTYLNMKENKIYFVERPRHGGLYDLINYEGIDSNLKIYDNYPWDVILADSCKAINTMGLS